MASDYVQVWKKMKYPELKKISDDELRNIISNNAAKVLAMPTNATASQVSEMYQLRGEQEAAAQILAERKEKRDKISASIRKWKEHEEEIPYKNFVKLKTASSANGQLVSAILEDEGDMSATELSGWCEEMAALDDSVFKLLLDELVMERVLVIKDGKYRLMHVCTPTLYPERPVEWGTRLLKQAGINELGLYHLILIIMDTENEPVNAASIREKRDSYSWLQGQNGIMKENFAADGRMIINCLQEMYKNKIIERLMIDGAPAEDPFYFFYRLGSYDNLTHVEEKKNPVVDGAVTATHAMDEQQCRNEILNYMKNENGVLVTLNDIKSGCPKISEMSNQSVIAVIRRMTEDKILLRTVGENLRPYYSLVKKES